MTTLAGLAGLPLEHPPQGLRRTGYQRVREQARVQLEGRLRGNGPYHELIPGDESEDGRPLGLAALPEPDPQAVAELFQRPLAAGTTFTDRKDMTRPLALDDLLVVAPYNAQVDRIRDRLAELGFPDARVGTVDKFQGQEAPVDIYSLASSSAEDAPRGMGFLYALDRLNVATSRARCVTFVVASPALLAPRCSSPEQMVMANAFVRYGEMAEGT